MLPDLEKVGFHTKEGLCTGESSNSTGSHTLPPSYLAVALFPIDQRRWPLWILSHGFSLYHTILFALYTAWERKYAIITPPTVVANTSFQVTIPDTLIYNNAATSAESLRIYLAASPRKRIICRRLFVRLYAHRP
jgi:hypothetical protein